MISKPTNTKALVLYSLLTGKEVTEQNLRLNGFRARLADIRKTGLIVKSKRVKFKNRFGRPSECLSYYLDRKDLKFAENLYKKINIDNRPKKGDNPK